MRQLNFFQLYITLLFALFSPVAAPANSPVIHHNLIAQFDPVAGTVVVEDTLTLPTASHEWQFMLHSDLHPQIIRGAADLIPINTVAHLRAYQLQRHDSEPITLRYSGRIQHSLKQMDESLGRSHQWSLGTIDAVGIFLNGNSGWYPRQPNTLQTFQLRAQLPLGWVAVAGGAGGGEPSTGVSTWTEMQPQEDITLVAAPFTVYRRAADGFEAQVYLREPNDALAERYLAATVKYVAHYSALLGAYPYAKFALVENFWESGYGMPSMTLLGAQVLRLPFIIDSSYPHEILHNWWGNSVYVDDSAGNWCEGLTTYLADHWLKERVELGAEYRRDALRNFANYVRTEQDFPLTAFQSRHDSASQAIGYGKGAMLFHMLRQQLGATTFQDGLRRFYADNRFRAASYADLQRAFEVVSGRDLRDFFTTWTTRTEAPRLALTAVEIVHTEAGYRVRGQVEQTQPAAPFPLQIPVVISQQVGEPLQLIVDSHERITPFIATLPSPPQQIAVDAAFDVFRELAVGETPVTLGALFGAKRGLIVLPAAASESSLNAYRQLATTWLQGHSGWQMRLDSELMQLPSDQPIWLFGWENQHLNVLTAGATEFSVDAATRRVQIKVVESDDATESVVLTRWHNQQPLAWLATNEAAALPALTRKLPHYGKYSYLNFSGAEATNQHKGQWKSGNSALVYRVESTD
ncbi:peptidase M28 [Chromatium weissei]|nr:peptidase M28 [Chromatium weissei]